MKIFKSFLVLSVLLLHKTYGQDCTPSANKCECTFHDTGLGYDLSTISKTDYYEASTNQSVSFYFHACGDTKSLPDFGPNVDNACGQEGYSLCMYSIVVTPGNATVNETVTKKTRVLGRIDKMDFKGNQLMFPQSEETKIATITLQCTPDTKDTVLYAPPNIDTNQIFLTLYSKSACLQQLIQPRGFFYTLFIVILSVLFGYLFIGIVVNYFLVGARGFELIPNYDFWCKAWLSLKLFFMYLKNGCRVIPAEDSYDAI